MCRAIQIVYGMSETSTLVDRKKFNPSENTKVSHFVLHNYYLDKQIMQLQGV